MSILFFDASVIVKRYIRERGSIWVRQICEAENEDGNQLNRVAIAENQPRRGWRGFCNPGAQE